MRRRWREVLKLTTPSSSPFLTKVRRRPTRYKCPAISISSANIDHSIPKIVSFGTSNSSVGLKSRAGPYLSLHLYFATKYLQSAFSSEIKPAFSRSFYCCPCKSVSGSSNFISPFLWKKVAKCMPFTYARHFRIFRLQF